MATEASFLRVCCGERLFSTQMNCVVSQVQLVKEFTLPA